MAIIESKKKENDKKLKHTIYQNQSMLITRHSALLQTNKIVILKIHGNKDFTNR